MCIYLGHSVCHYHACPQNIVSPFLPSDFRPKSVTPTASRAFEKYVVVRWLSSSDLIADQFAFRPLGGTTWALVYFMHHVISMLEHYESVSDYVRCLLVDFSKAFDRVGYVILGKKLNKL